MKPIGWFVKRFDELATHKIDAIQKKHGLTRQGWQVLHTIASARQDEELVAKTLQERVFPVVSGEHCEEWVGHFQEKGFLPQKGRLRLTAQGVDYHDQCFQEQAHIRKASMRGIPDVDYKTTVETLEKMIRNLESLPE